MSETTNAESATSTIDQPAELAVDLQLAIDSVAQVPNAAQFKAWANAAYATVVQDRALPLQNEVTVRVVSADEITALNAEFRGKNKATNVLSFAFEVPEGVNLNLLGDIIICHDVVAEEAHSEGKTVTNHYAHMVTHGILHLCGFDHQCDQTAEQMEALETQILALSHIPNPYQHSS